MNGLAEAEERIREDDRRELEEENQRRLIIETERADDEFKHQEKINKLDVIRERYYFRQQ
jgi:hypothetical protein